MTKFSVCGGGGDSSHPPQKGKPRHPMLKTIFVFFSIRVFFHRHSQFTGQQGKGGDHLYSSLPLPPAHEHSDI